jgi:hypothetical protein
MVPAFGVEMLLSPPARGYNMKFVIRSFLLLIIAISATTSWAGSSVEGTYKANGQEAKLAFALAYPDEPFSGNPTTQLIFTEQDASADENPGFHAAFGDFGSALIVRLMKDDDGYSVIGCEFGHKGLKHMGASATGVVDASDIKMTDGRISGHLATKPDADIFDEPVVVDLRFDLAISKKK